jgi:hypothetical protein
VSRCRTRPLLRAEPSQRRLRARHGRGLWGRATRDRPAGRDRAKDAVLWPDLSGKWRKSAEIQALGTGRSRREYPANKPNSGVASAWIAPRRPPVRVRLAPSREPSNHAGFRLLTGSRGAARCDFFGPVFGPIQPLGGDAGRSEPKLSSRFARNRRLNCRDEMELRSGVPSFELRCP